jgi:selenocysteine lyase/cysteine desulfurase
MEYFEWVGEQFGGEHAEALLEKGYTGRKLVLKQAMSAIRAYEFELNRAMIAALESIPGLRLYGLTDPLRLEERVATFSFRLKDIPPHVLAEKLAAENIYTWDGNYYALNVSERLGVEASGGMLRVGATHYNTLEEIERLKAALLKISA